MRDVIEGWRYFECEECGHIWKEKCRDYQTLSGSICPKSSDPLHEDPSFVSPFFACPLEEKRFSPTQTLVEKRFVLPQKLDYIEFSFQRASDDCFEKKVHEIREEIIMKAMNLAVISPSMWKAAEQGGEIQISRSAVEGMVREEMSVETSKEAIIKNVLSRLKEKSCE